MKTLAILGMLAAAAGISGANLTPAELGARKEAPLLLDVRSPAEFEAGHIPGAWNVPVEDVAARREEIRTRAGKKDIVVYCLSGARAAHAIKALASDGEPRVLHLTGDFSGWAAAQRPVEKGPAK